MTRGPRVWHQVRHDHKERFKVKKWKRAETGVHNTSISKDQHCLRTEKTRTRLHFELGEGRHGYEWYDDAIKIHGISSDRTVDPHSHSLGRVTQNNDQRQKKWAPTLFIPSWASLFCLFHSFFGRDTLTLKNAFFLLEILCCLLS